MYTPTALFVYAQLLLTTSLIYINIFIHCYEGLFIVILMSFYYYFIGAFSSMITTLLALIHIVLYISIIVLYYLVHNGVIFRSSFSSLTCAVPHFIHVCHSSPHCTLCFFTLSSTLVSYLRPGMRSGLRQTPVFNQHCYLPCAATSMYLKWG